MASARNEAPKTPRGRCGEGVSPSVRGGVWRAGYTPSQTFFFDFELKMASFCAFWELILLQLNYCLSYTHKPVSPDFGL